MTSFEKYQKNQITHIIHFSTHTADTSRRYQTRTFLRKFETTVWKTDLLKQTQYQERLNGAKMKCSILDCEVCVKWKSSNNVDCFKKNSEKSEITTRVFHSIEHFQNSQNSNLFIHFVLVLNQYTGSYKLCLPPYYCNYSITYAKNPKKFVDSYSLDSNSLFT